MIKIDKINFFTSGKGICNNYHNPKKILITGGVGDIFAIESYFPVSWYQTVEKIVFATRATKFVKDFFERKIIPFEKAKIEIIRADYSNPIEDIRQLINRTNYTDLENLVDCTIFPIFKMIKRNKLPYRGSSLIKNINVDLSRFNLPEKFVLICPVTNHDIRFPRNFDKQERETINIFLQEKGIKGVIVHHEKYEFANELNAIDLSTQTTMEESIAILKKASGMITVDSCLAVLGCQIFNRDQIIIKSNNNHYFYWIKPYTSPLNTRKMVVDKIVPNNQLIQSRNGLIVL